MAPTRDNGSGWSGVGFRVEFSSPVPMRRPVGQRKLLLPSAIKPTTVDFFKFIFYNQDSLLLGRYMQLGEIVP